MADTTMNGNHTTTDAPSHVRLDVAIIGGGVAGLAAAIALSLKGHKVTIYESNESLSEFGAGIQLYANSTRILDSWGLGERFNEVSNIPEVMSLLRWEDGKLIGDQAFNPFHSWTYGFPQLQVYRPDLQRLLYERAVDVGAKVEFGKAVAEVDTDKGLIVLVDGTKVEADLVIGADGIHSKSRRFLPQTANVKPKPYKEHTYRAIVPRQLMEQDPVTAELMTGRRSMVWMGRDCMVLGYCIAAGKLYNIVVSLPRPNPDAEVAKWSQSGDVREFRRLVKDWCPEVRHMTDKVESCAVWTLATVEKVQSYVSDSGRFALVGDAAHAVLPHAGQGGGQAIEDAAALAEFVSSMSAMEHLPKTMKAWFEFRQDRVERIRRIASENASTGTMHDGPQQQGRDRQIAAGSEAWKAELEQLGEDEMRKKMKREVAEPDPNAENFLSSGARSYMYGYDVVAEAKKYVLEIS